VQKRKKCIPAAGKSKESIGVGQVAKKEGHHVEIAVYQQNKFFHNLITTNKLFAGMGREQESGVGEGSGRGFLLKAENGGFEFLYSS